MLVQSNLPDVSTPGFFSSQQSEGVIKFACVSGGFCSWSALPSGRKDKGKWEVRRGEGSRGKNELEAVPATCSRERFPGGNSRVSQCILETQSA